MEHFHQNIPGWFHYDFLYDWIVSITPDGGHIVEVGSWKGASAAYMGVTIINSGKNIRFDCVDTWQGSPSEDYHLQDPDVVAGRLYEVFLENTAPVKSVITPVRMSSVQAAATYANESLDAVFIDAEHTFDAVCADIDAWLPKVKANGVLFGDDYCHPPVREAVNSKLRNIEQCGGQWRVFKQDQLAS